MKRSNKKKIFIISIIFTLSFILCIGVYFSEEIPVMNKIVKKFSVEKRYGINDKGIELAIKSNFIQDVGISDEHERLAFTVDNIIIDGRRMVIFYTIENKGDHKYINYLSYNVLDDKGENIPAGMSYPNYGDINLNKVKKIHDTFDLTLYPELEIPSSIQIDVKIKESQSDDIVDSKIGEEDNTEDPKELPYTWSINIPIDQELFKDKKICYDINKSVEFEGQKIFIDRLIVYPITSVLDVRYDKNNTKKIFSIEDFKLVDSSQEYKNGMGGIISSNQDDFTRQFYFESNYFKPDKEFYVVGSGIKGIDKDKLDVIVDVENSKLLKSPDSKLKLKTISENSDSYILVFEYPNDSLAFDFGFKDAKGTSLSNNSIGHLSREDGREIHFTIPKDVEFKNPITLTISDYEDVINKPFKIKVQK